jgi:hypothetical protein
VIVLFIKQDNMDGACNIDESDENVFIKPKRVYIYIYGGDNSRFKKLKCGLNLSGSQYEL